MHITIQTWKKPKHTHKHVYTPMYMKKNNKSGTKPTYRNKQLYARKKRELTSIRAHILIYMHSYLVMLKKRKLLNWVTLPIGWAFVCTLQRVFLKYFIWCAKSNTISSSKPSFTVGKSALTADRMLAEEIQHRSYFLPPAMAARIRSLVVSRMWRYFVPLLFSRLKREFTAPLDCANRSLVSMFLSSALSTQR